MVQKHKVITLQRLCLKASQDLISERCFHVARIVEEKKTKTTSSDGHTLESSCETSEFVDESLDPNDKECAVNLFITKLKEYIWSRVVWFIYDQLVSHILEGVIEAVEVMKAQWTIDTNMPNFRMKVCAMLKVGEVMHLKHLRSLNIDAMPKMIRPSVLSGLL